MTPVVMGEVAREREAASPAALAEEAELAAVVFVPSPEVWRRAGTPGGLSLLERMLKQLRTLGVQAPVMLLVPARDPEPVVSPACGATSAQRIPAGTSDLASALASAASLPAVGFALSADRLVDPRVLRALQRSGTTTFVADDGNAAEPIAWIHAVDVRRHGGALAARTERLRLSTLDDYSAELRGRVAPYVIRADTVEERRRAWEVLLEHVQKQALDLPGQYFDTPFENALVRRLAPTNVTPNQVTLLTLVVAMIVAGLFLNGWLRVGVLLALVVGVLDGVDGKLARLKLATSKLGELEHVGDFFYENAWYLALARHFHLTTQRPELWYAGLVLVGCDLVDSLLYLVVQRRTGRMLDELSTFDRRFRAIAGRRNVYVMIFVTGFFSGYGAVAFVAAVAWACVTVAVHAARALWVVASAQRVGRTA